MSQKLGIYDRGVFNKTENIFKFNKHKVEFFSLDDAQKIKGSKRDICYFCEIDECGYDEFNQIIMRTTDHILCCFNPSEPVHFIYDIMDDKDMPDRFQALLGPKHPENTSKSTIYKSRTHI